MKCKSCGKVVDVNTALRCSVCRSAMCPACAAMQGFSCPACDKDLNNYN